MAGNNNKRGERRDPVAMNEPLFFYPNGQTNPELDINIKEGRIRIVKVTAPAWLDGWIRGETPPESSSSLFSSLVITGQWESTQFVLQKEK